METLSDLDLINNIKKKKKVDECLQQLIDRHSGIYLDIVNSFLKNCNNDSLRDEIINDKEYAIRPKYGDKCWGDLLQLRIDEIGV